MELRQLEYFVAVAEEANFTRAAKRVHISQSGVSAQVRQLERELGQALLTGALRVPLCTGPALFGQSSNSDPGHLTYPSRTAQGFHAYTRQRRYWYGLGERCHQEAA